MRLIYYMSWITKPEYKNILAKSVNVEIKLLPISKAYQLSDLRNVAMLATSQNKKYGIIISEINKRLCYIEEDRVGEYEYQEVR